MYTWERRLFPSPFPYVDTNVTRPLSPLSLSILSVFLLHTKWRHVPVSKLECRTQKTQTHTTNTFLVFENKCK